VKKLPTVWIQSRQEGKAKFNKRMGISEKDRAGVNQGGISNQSEMLFHWQTKGNSLKDSSTYGIRTSQLGAGSDSKDCIMGRGSRGGGSDSGHDRSDISSNYSSGCSGVGAGGETGSGEHGNRDCVI